MERDRVPVVKGNESQTGDTPESLIIYTTRIHDFSSHTGDGIPRSLEDTRLGKGWPSHMDLSIPSPDSTPTEMETRFHQPLKRGLWKWRRFLHEEVLPWPKPALLERGARGWTLNGSRSVAKGLDGPTLPRA